MEVIWGELKNKRQHGLLGRITSDGYVLDTPDFERGGLDIIMYHKIRIMKRKE